MSSEFKKAHIRSLHQENAGYVQDIVIPKARTDKAIIIAMRQVKRWQLLENQNINRYTSGETCAAHITELSRQAITHNSGYEWLEGG